MIAFTTSISACGNRCIHTHAHHNALIQLYTRKKKTSASVQKRYFPRVFLERKKTEKQKIVLILSLTYITNSLTPRYQIQDIFRTWKDMKISSVTFWKGWYFEKVKHSGRKIAFYVWMHMDKIVDNTNRLASKLAENGKPCTVERAMPANRSSTYLV